MIPCRHIIVKISLRLIFAKDKLYFCLIHYYSFPLLSTFRCLRMVGCNLSVLPKSCPNADCCRWLNTAVLIKVFKCSWHHTVLIVIPSALDIGSHLYDSNLTYFFEAYLLYMDIHIACATLYIPYYSQAIVSGGQSSSHSCKRGYLQGDIPSVHR